MAIEDGGVLAKALAARPDDAPVALAAFAQERIARVSGVWRNASRNGRIYHLSPPASLLRDLGMGLLGGPKLLSNYDWIYRWQA